MAICAKDCQIGYLQLPRLEVFRVWYLVMNFKNRRANVVGVRYLAAFTFKTVFMKRHCSSLGDALNTFRPFPTFFLAAECFLASCDQIFKPTDPRRIFVPVEDWELAGWSRL